MTGNASDPMTDADWEKVFNNPAVVSVICETPKNTAPYHDENEDERLLENIRRQAPWMKRSMRRVLEEMEA